MPAVNSNQFWGATKVLVRFGVFRWWVHSTFIFVCSIMSVVMMSLIIRTYFENEKVKAWGGGGREG